MLGTHLSCTAHVCRGAHGGVQSGRVAMVICRDSSTPPSCQVTNAFRMKSLYNKTGFFCSLPNTSRKLPEKQSERVTSKRTECRYFRAFMPKSNFQIFNLFNIKGRIKLGTTAAWSGSLPQTPGLLFGGIEVLKPRCNCVFICSAGAVNCEGKRAGIDS